MMSKKVIIAILSGSALLLSATAIAAPAFPHGSSPLSTTAQLHKSVYIDKKNAGYKINKNLSVVGGYTKVSVGNKTEDIKTRQQQMVDVAAKATLPFKNGVNIFGKAGMAKFSAQNYRKLSPISTTVNVQSDSSTTYSKLLPYYGAGVGYQVSTHTDFDIQVSATPKSGTVPAMKATTIGLTYKF